MALLGWAGAFHVSGQMLTPELRYENSVVTFGNRDLGDRQ
jgi:hypothetical protein